MLIEYPKIETIFVRSEDGNKKLLDGVYRNRAVEYLSNCKWEWTEKIDGTNIRVYWDGHNASFHGRTDRANIPKPLLEYLQNKFGSNEAEELFEQLFGDKEVILFGEGYGPKIQKNGELYTDHVQLILFDIYVNGYWLFYPDVAGIATSFDVGYVPMIGEGPLSDAVEVVKSKPKSWLGFKHEMEGLVCRPAYPLRDRNGDRIIVKIKARDF